MNRQTYKFSLCGVGFYYVLVKLGYIDNKNSIVRILNRNHYYLGILSYCLFAAWFILTLLSLLPFIHLPWGYALAAFILNSFSFLFDKLKKKSINWAKVPLWNVRR